MNESWPMCGSEIHPLAIVNIDAEDYEYPLMKITSEKGLQVFLPPKSRPRDKLLSFMDSILISEAKRPVSSIYIKSLFVEGKNKEATNVTSDFLKRIAKEVIQEYALDPATFVFIKTQVFTHIHKHRTSLQSPHTPNCL